MTRRFLKGHALGNDYLVVLPGPEGGQRLSAVEVRRLCARHTGAGADGVVEVLRGTPGRGFDARVWNADGSTAEVSGNGLRIAALALAEDRSAPWRLLLRSAGRSYAVARRRDGRVEIALPAPRLGPTREALEVGTAAVRLTRVELGNPHVILALDEVDDARWPELAVALESHPAFPGRSNVERIVAVDRAAMTLAIEIHERGVGPTRASGTGAAASAAAAVALGLLPAGEIAVGMPGGEARVRVGEGQLRLASAVELVYEATLFPSPRRPA